MKETVSQLLSNYDKNEPQEKCGLILLDGTIIEVENVHPEPERGFKIPAAKLAEYDDDLYGTWHTHPRDTANLSEEDYKGFSQWADLRHFIIGIDGVRCFELEAGLVVEVKL